MENTALNEKLNLTIEEAASYSNIGINKIRELAKQPNCSFVIKVGRRTLIKRELFEEYLNSRTYI